MTPREFMPRVRARELDLEIAHDREALFTAYSIAHLGQFRRSVSPKEIFDRLRFRPQERPRSDPKALAEFTRKARERFKHLPGRSGNASAR